MVVTTAKAAAIPIARATLPADRPSSTRSRAAFIIHDSGLRSATHWNQPCMRAVGKNAEETKSRTNTRGKKFCTASWDPVRSPMAAANPPMATASSTATTIRVSTARGPPSTRAPKSRNTPMKNTACTAPRAMAPPSRPSRMAARDTGEETSRSKNPSWMSRARSAPPMMPPNSTPWMSVAGRRNCRNDSAGGNPGRSTVRPSDAAFTAAMSRGNTRPGTQAAGWRAVESTARRPSATVAGRSVAPRVTATPGALTAGDLCHRGGARWVLRGARPPPRRRGGPAPRCPRRRRPPRAGGRWPRRTRRRGSAR